MPFLEGDMSKMMLYMFLGLIVAILILGFRPPAQGGTSQNRTTTQPLQFVTQPNDSGIQEFTNSRIP